VVIERQRGGGLPAKEEAAAKGDWQLLEALRRLAKTLGI
jgi:hypothetical protein